MLLQVRAYLRAAVLMLLASNVSLAEDPLKASGLAVYTDTARDIYVAALMTPGGQLPQGLPSVAGPMAMEYRIATRRISSRGFSGTLLLQAELGSGSRAPEGVINSLGELKRQIEGSLLSGDRFRISLTGSGQTSFSLNGRDLMAVDDAAVFEFLISGWVGESSSALFRDSLLADEIEPGLRGRYESLLPSEERVLAVAQWGKRDEPTQVAARPKAAPVVTTVVTTTVAATAVAKAPEAAAAPVPEASGAESPVVGEPEANEQALAATDTVPEQPPEPAAQTEPAETQLSEDLEAEPLVAANDILVVEEEQIDDREYQRQLNEFVVQVMNKVFRNVRYPRRAVKKEYQGQVEILAELTQAGELVDVTMGNSSGYSILDRAAVAAVEGAAPFPELNDVARQEFMTDGGESYVIVIPVTFKMN